MAAFSFGLRTPVDSLLLSFFVLCGLSRLARFNVTAATVPKDASGKAAYFEGTPIPTTMGITAIMAVWLQRGWVLDNLPLGLLAKGSIAECHTIALLFALHGCLMISKSIHIPKP